MTAMIMVMCFLTAMTFVFVQRQRNSAAAKEFEGMRVPGFQMTALWLVEAVRVGHGHHRLGQ